MLLHKDGNESEAVPESGASTFLCLRTSVFGACLFSLRYCSLGHHRQMCQLHIHIIRLYPWPLIMLLHYDIASLL
ncbi:unnamed protein product [Gordionus sp. m RMFG-2023]